MYDMKEIHEHLFERASYQRRKPIIALEYTARKWTKYNDRENVQGIDIPKEGKGEGQPTPIILIFFIWQRKRHLP